MEKQKIIETLEDLSSYINGNWEMNDADTKKEAEKSIDALENAITIISSSNVVGILELNNERYIISKE